MKRLFFLKISAWLYFIESGHFHFIWSLLIWLKDTASGEVGHFPLSRGQVINGQFFPRGSAPKCLNYKMFIQSGSGSLKEPFCIHFIVDSSLLWIVTFVCSFLLTPALLHCDCCVPDRLMTFNVGHAIHISWLAIPVDPLWHDLCSPSLKFIKFI